MEQLFLHILNNAITVSFLIIAIILVRAVFRKIPKWIVCVLWLLVVVKLIVPINIESIYGLIPNGEPISKTITIDNNSQMNSSFEIIEQPAKPIIQGPTSPIEHERINPVQVGLKLGTIIWLTGIMAMLLYDVVTYMLLKQKVKSSVKLTDVESKNIYVCDYITDPFILGIIRPRIYLPSNLSEASKEYVIKHEITHLKRKDNIWKPLGFLGLSIYWFQPLCWIAYILLCRDIEYACDEKASNGENDAWRANYCQALLDCSKQRKMITACPVAFGENGVKGRVKNLLNYKRPAFWIVLISIILCIVLAVCFGTNMKTSDSKESEGTENAGSYSYKFDANTDCQADIGEYPMEAFTENGYYSLQCLSESNNSKMLYYYDYATKQSVLVCGKTNCQHKDDTCDAFFDEQKYPISSIWYYEGNVYIPSLDEDYLCITKIAPDGSTRKKMCSVAKIVQVTEEEEDGGIATATYYPAMVLHDGYIYYSSSYPGCKKAELYKKAVDDNADAIKLDEIEGDSVQIYRIKGYGENVFYQKAVFGEDGDVTDGGIYVYNLSKAKSSLIVKDAVSYYCLDENGNIYYHDNAQNAIM